MPNNIDLAEDLSALALSRKPRSAPFSCDPKWEPLNMIYLHNSPFRK
jgi:hypothetical protein